MAAADPRVSPRRNHSQLLSTLILAYQSFGVVYGNLSTSPLYVFRSIFIGKLDKHQNEEAVFGAFCLIFWTLTLISLLKYGLVLLSADDNGEGGTFALYSLLCRHAKLSLLPNQQAADEELSAYKFGLSTDTGTSSPFRRFLEKHRKLRTALLVVVLFGAAIVIGDGVLTPAISVLSSISGLQATEKILTDGELLVLACVILVGLFALQHCGTHWVAFMFAPIVIIWLISILFIGLYNIIHWNPKIIHAISPLYIIKFFRLTGQDGWISLGGVLLSVTGTEAMFANLGHFTSVSIRLAFVVVVYPCLVVQYMGQAAFLSKNLGSIPNSFYDSIRDTVFWPVFVIATLAASVGSLSVITATFSIIKQCHALGCFPRIKVVHTSKHRYGQIFIPEINWILMIITLAIAIGFRDTTLIGNAYGVTCMIAMVVTTFLMALVIVVVWQKSCFLAALFLGTLWIIEGAYLSAAFMKVPQGGWVSLVLGFIFMIAMYVWHYGTRRKYSFDLHNKVSSKWLMGLGPSLGIVRVPGIGLVYSELATGVPAIFSHFVTNVPAFHKVVVFVCVKSVPVPYVSPEERFLIGRVCPKPYRMYRCIVRYGYKDIQREDNDFENQLVQSIAEFIQMEASDLQFSSSQESQSYEGRMAVISSQKSLSNSILTVSEVEETDYADPTIHSSKSTTLQSLRSVYEDEYPQGQLRRRCVRFRLTPSSGGIESSVREELMDLIRAKEAGVAYIMGHSYVKARKSSSWLKKITIDIGYSFLRKNCRGPAVALNIPHISLIEVATSSIETFMVSASEAEMVLVTEAQEPRISFSMDLSSSDSEEDFICINNPVNLIVGKEEKDKISTKAGDFEFLSENVTMLTADELFCEGKLLPFLEVKHSDKLKNIKTTKVDKEEEDGKVVKEEIKEQEINNNNRGTWFIDDDPSPRPPNCTVLWKELLRLKKQKTTTTKKVSSSLSPSSSSSSTSSSSSLIGDVVKVEEEKGKKGLQRTRSVTMRIRPMVHVPPVCTPSKSYASLPPLFPLRLQKNKAERRT